MRFSLSSAVPMFLVAGAALAFPGSVEAQFNNAWLTFSNESGTRLGVAPTAISSANDEVDFAFGDLDHNGLVDLVVARKQPFTSSGKRPNLLLMNENGVLQDRTALYASASDVPGDQGFLTPTNDRDIVVADVNGDGWLDVITATTLSAGNPKHISHPRVYLNLGAGVSGWNGLRHEDARIPQFMNGATPVAPGFCGASAGDVNADGAVDLYFSDYSGSAGMTDINDRLLINDGNGFFTDESTLRMTAQMLDSGFGTSAVVADMNGDSYGDVVKDWAGVTRITYNDRNNAGFFNLYTAPYEGSAYHINAGDLNSDGRLDVVVSDDGLDRFAYNTGVDPFGGVKWGTFKTFTFLSGGDGGIGGQNYILDLDQDGFGEPIIADVDVDIPGCGGRIHVHHNRGGLAGSQMNLYEERESASAGWIGAKGLLQGDLTGGYDVAVFDVNGDGSNDMVLGRCSGTFVWINSNTCQQSLGAQGPGHSTLSMCGGDLSTGSTATLRLNGAAPAQTALLFLGLTANPTFVSELGGSLVPVPVLGVIALATDANGSIAIPNVPGGGGPFDVISQFVITDPSQPKGYQLSNALKIHFDS